MNSFPVRWLLFALLAMGSTTQALAAAYFVNSNGGNDNYNGTSPAWTAGVNGPWQTLGRLANVPLAPNDTVYLACGGVWNETLTVSSSGAVNVPITVTSGPGYCAAPPLIDGAAPIPAHQWVQHSGSIYRASLPTNLVTNPNQVIGLAGWAQWSSSGDTLLGIDAACPGQLAPCVAFTSGSSLSLLSSNNFEVIGGNEYTAGIQLRGMAGVQVKVVVRRAGPTYERLAPEQLVTMVGNSWQSVGFIFRATTSLKNARLDIEVPSTKVRVNIREAKLIPRMSGAEVVGAFVDGRQLRTAHHPNLGQSGIASSPFASIVVGGSKTVLDSTGLLLPAGAILTPGIGATIRTVNWAIEERVVADVAGPRLTLTGPTAYAMQPGYGYYLTGALWMLDSPGEWFFDSKTSTVYVWMPDGTSPGNRFSYSQIATGADLNGRANVNLSGISIRHVRSGIAANRASSVALSSMSVSDAIDFGVIAENCVQCSVIGSRVTMTGLDGISAPGWLTDKLVVRDSIVEDSGSTVRVDGWPLVPRPAKAAINAVGVRSSILRNQVRGAAYAGIILGANGVATGNRVEQTCTVLNDCGAIYVNYVGNNATITGNIVAGVIGGIAGLPSASYSQTAGIYLDDHNSNSVVTGNTIADADYGLHIHNANGIVVSGNVMFGNRRYQMWLQEQTQTLRSSGDVFGNRIADNLLVPTDGGNALFLESTFGSTVNFGIFSNNHYSALNSQRIVGERASNAVNSFTPSEWNASGRETGAYATQPIGYAPFLMGSINLVPNGNLANGRTGWTWWNSAAPNATGTLLNCGFAPCIKMTAGASTSLLTSPNFSVVSGQWYRVSFDALTSTTGRRVTAVVRRGGGGDAGYEFLMPSAESLLTSTSWRRYSFVFQAKKTVSANDPVTQENGARIDFQTSEQGLALTVARLEMVTMAAPNTQLDVKLLLNREDSAMSIPCASIGVLQSACRFFVHMDDESVVAWPATIASRSGRPIYTRDNTLTDSDGDGIADSQDHCPATPIGLAVDSRGCAFGQ